MNVEIHNFFGYKTLFIEKEVLFLIAVIKVIVLGDDT